MRADNYMHTRTHTYMCTYRCVKIHIVRTCTHTCTHACTHTHTHIHTHSHTCTRAGMLAHTHTYTCTHAHTHTRTHRHMNNHIFSTLFNIQERKSDRRSREIEQRKESQNTHTHIKQGHVTLIYCINIKSRSSLKGLEKYIFKYLIKTCNKNWLTLSA